MADEPVVDLNKAANVEMNRDVAFEVYAENANGTPKLDLPADQRWRGTALRNYSGGRWTNNVLPKAQDFRDTAELDSTSRSSTVLPDLGPEQYFVTVQYKEEIRVALLADPIQLGPLRQTPVIQILPNNRVGTFALYRDGSFVPVEIFRGHYKQVTRPGPDPNWGPEYPPDQILAFRSPLPNEALPGRWTELLLGRLADADKLPREAVTDRLGANSSRNITKSSPRLWSSTSRTPASTITRSP